jgi:hypothetical protein
MASPRRRVGVVQARGAHDHAAAFGDEQHVGLAGRAHLDQPRVPALFAGKGHLLQAGQHERVAQDPRVGGRVRRPRAADRDGALFPRGGHDRTA